VTRIRLIAGGIEATAELDGEGSPDAVRAFAATLPLDGELLGSVWSGNGCELALPEALRRVVGGGAASVDVPVGTLAIVASAEGAVLIIPYGIVKTHLATGPVAATRVARFVAGQDAFLARVERTFDEGAIAVRIVAEQ
jgi:hypothetical protein